MGLAQFDIQGPITVDGVTSQQQGRSHQATGHWRAINPGDSGSITVTSGVSDAQLRTVRGPDRSDSQADSAGSIPVTRSTYVDAGQGHYPACGQ
jgi:hypothetical protein